MQIISDVGYRCVSGFYLLEDPYECAFLITEEHKYDVVMFSLTHWEADMNSATHQRIYM